MHRLAFAWVDLAWVEDMTLLASAWEEDRLLLAFAWEVAVGRNYQLLEDIGLILS